MGAPHKQTHKHRDAGRVGGCGCTVRHRQPWWICMALWMAVCVTVCDAKKSKSTDAPTPQPTPLPTSPPTRSPTRNPTRNPTRAPTRAPTPTPTHAPTRRPTRAPTRTPTAAPTHVPSHAPTGTPTFRPTSVTAVVATSSTDVRGASNAASDNQDGSISVVIICVVISLCVCLLCLCLALLRKRRKDKKDHGPVSPTLAVPNVLVAVNTTPGAYLHRAGIPESNTSTLTSSPSCAPYVSPQDLPIYAEPDAMPMHGGPTTQQQPEYALPKEDEQPNYAVVAGVGDATQDVSFADNDYEAMPDLGMPPPRPAAQYEYHDAIPTDKAYENISDSVGDEASSTQSLTNGATNAGAQTMYLRPVPLTPEQQEEFDADALVMAPNPSYLQSSEVTTFQNHSNSESVTDPAVYGSVPMPDRKGSESAMLRPNPEYGNGRDIMAASLGHPPRGYDMPTDTMGAHSGAPVGYILPQDARAALEPSYDVGTHSGQTQSPPSLPLHKPVMQPVYETAMLLNPEYGAVEGEDAPPRPLYNAASPNPDDNDYEL